MFDDTIIFFFLLWIVDTSTNIWGGAYQIAIKTFFFIKFTWNYFSERMNKESVTISCIKSVCLLPYYWFLLKKDLSLFFKCGIYLLLVVNITFVQYIFM